MTTVNASSLLAESLATLSKSVQQTFAAIENQARIDVAQAVSEANDARHERDGAVRALQEFQLEAQAWKLEVGACKASLKQSEMTIAHQVETISQLRREATQWKDQSRNWQEHFLRVEQERCALSTRIEELVSEQLLLSRITLNAATFTPQPKYVDAVDSALSSVSTNRASTSSNQPPAYKSTIPISPPDVVSPSDTIVVQKSSRSAQKTAKTSKSKPSNTRVELPPYPAPTSADPASSKNVFVQVPKTQKSTQRSPTRKQRPATPTQEVQDTRPAPRQTLIRRVQAVVHVPVKEEDTDDDSFGPDGSSNSASVSNSVEDQSSLRRTSTRKRKTKVVQDEGGSSAEEEDVRESEDPSFNEGSIEEVEDEDDELMMGVEDNHKEVYGMRRVASSTHPTPVASNKKRKPVGTGGREKPPAKTRKL